MCERFRLANDDALEKRIQWIQNTTSLQKHRLNRQKKMRTFLVCLLMQGRFANSGFFSTANINIKDLCTLNKRNELVTLCPTGTDMYFKTFIYRNAIVSTIATMFLYLTASI